jgi:hypothetical protein
LAVRRPNPPALRSRSLTQQVLRANEVTQRNGGRGDPLLFAALAALGHGAAGHSLQARAVDGGAPR